MCKAPARGKRLKQYKGFSQPTVVLTLSHRRSKDQSPHFIEMFILQGVGAETGTPPPSTPM